MNIRRATEDDARRISYLIQKNTQYVTANQYTPEQIETWIAANTPRAILTQLKNRIIFCAYHHSRLIGTIGLQGHEVVGLYVSYRRIGQGIGQKLLLHLEEYVKAHHIPILELTSTPSAKGFYERNGYVSQGETFVNVNGVIFSETKMVKQLV